MSTPDEQQTPLDSPSPPMSPEETVSSPLGSSTSPRPPSRPTHAASEMSTSTVSSMTASSQPLGNLNAARRPGGAPLPAAKGGMNNPDIAARMRAFHISRQNTPSQVPTRGTPSNGTDSTASTPPVAGFPSGFKLPPHMQRPAPHGSVSSPAVPGSKPPGKGPSLAEKRGLRLPGGLPGAPASPNPAAPGAPAGRQKPKMTLSSMGGGEANGGPNGAAEEKPKEQSQLDKYSEFIDTKNGALTFKGKATVNAEGINFTSGKTFSISLDEVDTLDELGKGNYGTVYKVRHSRPKFRRAGQGLAGNKAIRPTDRNSEDEVNSPNSPTSAGGNKDGTSGIIMAMKEMRLELDDAKFQSIIMELDILHRCISPYIIDFYGAFFQEGAVYICIEFMDGGSMDKIYGDGVPESILRKMTLATTLGLKSLKEEHNIIHRDVKPTNILVNTKGQFKICDFGVSGNLVASIAKTNIGCQSYMAPERISSGGMAQAGAGAGTYSVQSDIWSLGLTIIECALGRYPYPPETYDNIFSQLSAIVDGEPPDLPSQKFSEAARNFVAGCLNKIPKLRPTYPMLLQHAWLAPMIKPETIMEEDEEAAEAEAANGSANFGVEETTNGNSTSEGVVDREVADWVIDALEKRKKGTLGKSAKPALHAAPLDATVGNGSGVQPVAV
ncbi:hypothetical protein BAUCODRAFT_38378 [Baudoinia panamericana UAMH 10762]|uniref:mitogen-activated protein kinase kinase n=1 Tax=Baudoinia panamericana (strain UAMH 10762) TaxID=717646 RepID=M2M7M9_BAUPA|nr:uncharacterized protein BAUCODRAFT_38378 [Baudoinia panamericana UAMH 10762]EMC92331.1 hypothetical protein BAUCODRAFT_38378 [Baudoinia panamericana UAMH 10762]